MEACHTPGLNPEYTPAEDRPACVLKELPPQLAEDAARVAATINPANHISKRVGAALGVTPQRIALLTSKYWGPKVDLGVTFLDVPAGQLRTRILFFANKWGKFGNIRFRESNAGEIRLTTGAGGYWSYLGTDILSVRGPTMNLERFSMATPDSEYDRVVCHEFGHTLGFPHEHERPEILNLLDVNKTVAWFAAHYGWDRQTTLEQVFDPIDPRDIIASLPDARSIMCYQFAGACTKSGLPIPGGDVIDATDQAFVASAKVYPLVVAPPPPPPPPPPPIAPLVVTIEVSADGRTLQLPAGVHLVKDAQ